MLSLERGLGGRGGGPNSILPGWSEEEVPSIPISPAHSRFFSPLLALFRTKKRGEKGQRDLCPRGRGRKGKEVDSFFREKSYVRLVRVSGYSAVKRKGT